MIAAVVGGLDSTPIKCQTAIPTAAMRRVVTTEEFSSGWGKFDPTFEENSFWRVFFSSMLNKTHCAVSPKNDATIRYR